MQYFPSASSFEADVLPQVEFEGGEAHDLAEGPAFATSCSQSLPHKLGLTISNVSGQVVSGLVDEFFLEMFW